MLTVASTDPVSVGTQIRIRQFVPNDAPHVFAAIQESLNDVSLWMPNLNASLSLEAVRAYIADQPHAWSAGTAYNFAIVEALDDSLLGGCGLTQINRQHRFANLYYWVRSSRARQGVASAAVVLLARFGFDTLALRRVEIVVAVGNPASIRVAEKVGATREGKLRNRITVGDQVHDAFMFSLIPADLERGTTHGIYRLHRSSTSR